MSKIDLAGRNSQSSGAKRDDLSSRRLFINALLIGSAYYAGALVGFALTFSDDAVSTLWPPNAILLAGLLLTPTASWWAIIVATLPAHLVVQLQTNVPILMTLSWFISNSAEALVGAWLFRYFVRREIVDFSNFRHVVIFTMTAVLFSPFATSFLDAGLVVLNQWKQPDFWEVWKMRFPANALAALTVAPAIIIWHETITKHFWVELRVRWVEGVIIISGLSAVSLLVFSWQSAGANTLPTLVYIPLPILLWAAVRFGSLGSSTCVLIVSLISIWGTVHGRGPFVSSSPVENVHWLQLFLVFIATLLLLFVSLLEERRLGEQARALAAAIVESSHDAIIGCTLEGIISTWNRGAEKLYGYSPAEAIGQPVTILTAPEAGDVPARILDKIKAGKGIQSFEDVRITKEGRRVDVAITVSPVIDVDGNLAGLSSITRDITEEKKVREALLRSEAKFSGILTIAADAIISVNESYRIILFNEGAEKIFRYSKAEVIGQPLEILIPAQFRAEHGNHIHRFSRSSAISREMAERQQILGLRKGGEEFPAEASISQLQLSGERIFTVVLRDISERRAAEQTLRETEKRLAATEDFSLVMVTHTDLDGRWLKVPPTLCRLLGYTERELLGHRFNEITHPADIDHNISQRERLLRGEIRSFDMEKRYICKDGRLVWVYINVSAVTDEKGTPLHCLSYIRDITDRKRAEEELRGAMAEIRQLKDRLEAENVYLRSEVSEAHRYGEMARESEGIKKVFEQVERVAPTDMTVLVLGETGVGKELVARMVHEKSGRRERPLVKVNCSTLPAELIESELFGHERGAFTGAVSKQVGRFELADGGTIFLDEVGELPLGLQAKLLRVLQEGEFERLGSGKTMKVDVRVIAATNRNLSEAAQLGRFRTDLYYRLNVYPIEVPPLRERREDIGRLAEVFLQESAHRLGKRFGKLTQETIEALRQYGWPGNVRELENVIARAAIISNSPTLQLSEGWNRETHPFHDSAVPRSNDSVHWNSETANRQQEPLAALERAHIVEILQQTNWRIEGPKGAALILGLHPNTLRSRMHKLGVQRPGRSTNGDADPKLSNRSVESQS
jgi:formate hydrogenlyase transcriptional activator